MSTRRLAPNARAELAALEPERRCDRLAEISALFHTAGTVHLRGRGELSFHLDFAESAVARRAYSILKRLRVASERESVGNVPVSTIVLPVTPAASARPTRSTDPPGV